METKWTFSNAMKTVTLTVTGAIAKVTHKEQSGRKINSKKMMNISVNATMIFLNSVF